MDQRLQQLQHWVNQSLSSLDYRGIDQLESVSGDASFRRYFRQNTDQGSLIAVDAPPEKENSQPFVDIARQWHAQGVQVPTLLNIDLTQGFMLLSDFGDRLLLPSLTDQTADQLYGQAIDSLIHIQQTQLSLPPYDQALLDREMALFQDWYLEVQLGLTLNRSDKSLLADTFSLLRDTALGQPQVPVHRDFHSRNLMLLNDHSIGIIDFQDAVQGPYTYDLVSLLRDCYIAWPQEKVEEWAILYFKKAHHQGVGSGTALEQQMLWFDWMGLQRHLKAIGIFSRLCHRDGKHAYLHDIPRTLNYVLQVSSQYEGMEAFHQWLQQVVVPAQKAKESAS